LTSCQDEVVQDVKIKGIEIEIFEILEGDRWICSYEWWWLWRL